MLEILHTMIFGFWSFSRETLSLTEQNFYFVQL